MSEILRACAKTYPDRPALEPAEWPYTREELDARIDHWMHQLGRIETTPPAPRHPPENTAQRSNQKSVSGPTPRTPKKPENE